MRFLSFLVHTFGLLRTSRGWGFAKKKETKTIRFVGIDHSFFEDSSIGNYIRRLGYGVRFTSDTLPCHVLGVGDTCTVSTTDTVVTGSVCYYDYAAPA